MDMTTREVLCLILSEEEVSKKTTDPGLAEIAMKGIAAKRERTIKQLMFGKPLS